MCGRYSLIKFPEGEARDHGVTDIPVIEPRYNIAPTQLGPVAFYDQALCRLSVRNIKWGLVSNWIGGPSKEKRIINARGETLRDKPLFRSSFLYGRCLVPATGFYEWHAGDARTRTPYYITLRDEEPFFFAGLTNYTDSPEMSLKTFAIVTTRANSVVARIHHRMPVILKGSFARQWLEPGILGDNWTEKGFKPFDSSKVAMREVGAAVNKSSFEGPECVEAITKSVGQQTFQILG